MSFFTDFRASANAHPQPLLHLAIMKSYSRVVQRLIKAGVDVDHTGSDGTTPLSLACKVGDLDQKAIEYKTFSNMKAIERQEREHTMRLIQTEKSLVGSQNALGRTAIEAAETQLRYKQAGLGGSFCSSGPDGCVGW